MVQFPTSSSGTFLFNGKISQKFCDNDGNFLYNLLRWTFLSRYTEVSEFSIKKLRRKRMIAVLIIFIQRFVWLNE